MWTNTLDRGKIVEKAYQRGEDLTLNNRNYLRWLTEFFDQEYREDVRTGDVTSESVLPKNKLGKAILKAKQSGVIGGVEEVSWFFKRHGLKVKVFTQDGEEIRKGSTILDVYGSQRDILTTERISLNAVQRMSGIATETRILVDLLRNYKTRVAATRKTHWRYLDKKAVFLGGGLTHRLGLWDSILIKDNHLEALRNKGVKNPIERAIALASRFADKVNFIEIEVTNQDDAVKAARKIKQLKLKKPSIILLDNVTPREVEQMISSLRNENLYNYVLIEASGNITRKNIKKYAKTGIDVVSLGYLTHSTRSLDMSLEITN
jgi:nicotinate-nucleotide pyrophosphorylase (carboxylating)